MKIMDWPQPNCKIWGGGAKVYGSACGHTVDGWPAPTLVEMDLDGVSWG